MSEPLWASGPAEILRHGLKLLRDDSDTNRRLAMISIDNSVELLMQTYIQLPKRLSGLDLTRKQRDTYCENFSSLLDGIEATVGDRISGLNLGEIEWFHRLRNELYHQGNGLTIERLKVEAYAEIAKRLFSSLFGDELNELLEESESMDLLGQFLAQWARLESSLRKRTAGPKAVPLLGFYQLKDSGLISETEFHKLKDLKRLRDSLVHGQKSPQRVLNSALLLEMKQIVDKFS